MGCHIQFGDCWSNKNVCFSCVLKDVTIPFDNRNRSYKASEEIGEAFITKFCHKSLHFGGLIFGNKIEFRESSRKMKCTQCRLEHLKLRMNEISFNLLKQFLFA